MNRLACEVSALPSHAWRSPPPLPTHTQAVRVAAGSVWSGRGAGEKYWGRTAPPPGEAASPEGRWGLGYKLPTFWALGWMTLRCVFYASSRHTRAPGAHGGNLLTYVS